MEKSPVFALGLLSVLCAGALNAQAADTGTITFNGNIVDNTCAVSVNARTGGPNGTITLPDVSATTLKEAGSTAGKTDFKLEVSLCAGVASTVAAEFSALSIDEVVSGEDISNKVAANVGEMLNTATNGAEHVSLLLMNDDETPIAVSAIDAHMDDKSNYIDIADSGAATIPLSVQYHSAGDATGGPVTGATIYQLVYK
ncbi:MAG TPA: fimbrial protein [Buttiauxella sp.]|jgi:major type 1 subunit fimbrin (pilin)